MTMKPDEAAKVLSVFNAWRCDEHGEMEPPSPRQVTAALGVAVAALEAVAVPYSVLKCEHANLTTKYDHIHCDDCGAVHSDSMWGENSNRWFASESAMRAAVPIGMPDVKTHSGGSA